MSTTEPLAGDAPEVEVSAAEIPAVDATATDVPATKTETNNKADQSAEQNGKSTESVPESDAKVTEVITAEEKAEDAGDHDHHEKRNNGHSKYDKNPNYKGKHENHREHHRPRGNESKFDPSVLPESRDAQEIRNQVEFYFGDSNLPTDNFLWGETDGAENKPVAVKLIHGFKRMKRFQPYSAVVDALKKSTSLTISGEEGEETITRKVPYNPNSIKSASRLRSIYVKGFGDELPSTQFDIEAFFAPYGPVNAVRLRRTDDKLFKGSVFVEFSDQDTADKFLELDPKPQYQGRDLKIMTKVDYEEMKIQDIKDGKCSPNATRYNKFRGNRGGHRNKGGDRYPDDWKKRREDDQRSGFRGRGGRGGRDRFGRGDRDNRNNRNNDRKRNRDDDEDQDDKPSKKVDTKEELGDISDVKAQTDVVDAEIDKKVESNGVTVETES